MRRSFTLAVGLAAASVAGPSLAQPVFVDAEGFPARAAEPVGVASVSFPALDIRTLYENEAQRRAQGNRANFAVRNKTSISPRTYGVAEDLGNGRIGWSLTITCDNARNINLGTRYHVPPSTIIFMEDAQGFSPLEPYTAMYNYESGEIWTPPIEGNTLRVYAEVDAQDWDAFADGFEIISVNLGFITLGEVIALLPDGGPVTRSNSCHIDVACAEADPYDSMVSSVGMILIGGSGFCSGALMNNTAEDGTPYFMTAWHCNAQGSPGSNTVVWNYQNSFCRTPGSGQSGAPGNGSLVQQSAGSTLRMQYPQADTVLLRLNSAPDPSWNIDFAGWDRTTAHSTSAIGIHHPNGQEKRIAFEFDQITTGVANLPGQAGILAWSVNFDEGGLEGGSSGSPLYNDFVRVIGVATAVTTTSPVCGPGQSQLYGRLNTAWTGGGTASTRLSNWLDPVGTGQMTLDPLDFDPPRPGPFGLTHPAPGEEGIATEPTMTWEASANATSYDVVIERDPPLSVPVFEATVETNSLVMPAGVLVEEQQYTWSVVAHTPYGIQSSSPTSAGFTTLTDCNQNSMHDAFEIATGFTPDCNDNGVPDDCDIAPRDFYNNSGELNGFGSGFPKTHTLVAPPAPVSDVTLTIRARSDLSSVTEYVTLEINGQSQGFIFQTGATDCPPTYDQTQVVLTPGEFDDLLALNSGNLAVTLTPSSAVSPTCSGTNSFVQVITEYQSVGTSADTNGDMIPDECDAETCPGDLTTTGTTEGQPGFGEPDGVTNLSDLLFFVNIWNADFGTPTPNPGSGADVTTTGSAEGQPAFGEPDGNVDLSDLLYFVNLWNAGLPQCP